MSETLSGSYSALQRLSSSLPDVTISGSVTAYGSVGGYTLGGALHTLYAAVFGPAGTVFTVDNAGFVQTTGALTPYDAGIGLASLGTVINSSTVLGASGIADFGTEISGQAGFVGNSGEINGSLGVGIYLTLGSVTNSGSISGAQNAIDLRDAGGSVTNTGSGVIFSGTGEAVGIEGGGMINNAGLISGYSVGAGTGGGSGTSYLTLQNSGTILQTSTAMTNSSYAAVYTQNGGSITNTGAGLIKGKGDGILLGAGTLSLDNAGSIASGGVYFVKNGITYGDAAVGLFGGGYISNAASGAIDGLMFGIGAMESAGTALSIANAGLIEATTSVLHTIGIYQEMGIAIGLNNGGLISNAATGTISGVENGVVITSTGNAVSVQNSGLIEATGPAFTLGTTSIYPNGVGLATGGVLSNTSHGVITGVSAAYVANGTSGLPGILENDGTLAGSIAGAVLNRGAALTNSLTGTISGGHAGIVQVSPGLAVNAGLIEATVETFTSNGTINDSGGAVLDAAGTLINEASGRISGDIGAALLNGGTLIDAGTIGNTGSGLAVYFGGAAETTLAIDPGAMLAGEIYDATGAGELDLAAGIAASGSFDMGGTVTGFNDVVFETGTQWRLEGTASELLGTPGPQITGFTYGDTIVLDNFSGVSESLTGGGIALSNNITTEDLNLQGSIALNDFQFTTLNGNTTITALCYLRGTRIATPAGERNVEELRAGDVVETRFSGPQAVKWLGIQRYDSRFLKKNPEKMPVCILPGALGPGQPRAPLYVSPGHAMLVGETLVLAKNLVNGITVTQGEMPELVEYYAIELETHDCVIANGAYGESFADGPGLRGQFHNLPEFFEAFPDYAEPDEIRLCLKRPERGAELGAALTPVVASAAAWMQAGPLRGYIDLVTPEGRVEGWAQDVANPELPVRLELFDGERKLSEVLACDYREDLAAAGIGRGYHMFGFDAPAGAAIRVRRMGDGAEIFATEPERKSA